jgi:multiple sugar transport system ATP-binding protein
VPLGRAIVRNPQVFLFDEPLSNLDDKMRVHMRSEISRLHSQLGNTMVYVTHDQVEAMTMGDRICVMKDGAIMQVADPLTLYRQPENLFVAGFIGSPPMNLLKGKIERRDGGLVFTETAEQNAVSVRLIGQVEALGSKLLDKPVIFGVRPEHLTEESKNGSHVPVASSVDIAEPMGSESLVYLKAGTGNLIARIHGEALYEMGQPLTVYVNMDKVLLFDSETEKVIR